MLNSTVIFACLAHRSWGGTLGSDCSEGKKSCSQGLQWYVHYCPFTHWNLSITDILRTHCILILSDFLCLSPSNCLPLSHSLTHVLIQMYRHTQHDMAGLSDPYVIIKYGSEIMFRTHVIEKSLNPEWNESVSLAAPSRDDIIKVVYCTHTHTHTHTHYLQFIECL